MNARTAKHKKTPPFWRKWIKPDSNAEEVLLIIFYIFLVFSAFLLVSLLMDWLFSRPTKFKPLAWYLIAASGGLLPLFLAAQWLLQRRRHPPKPSRKPRQRNSQKQTGRLKNLAEGIWWTAVAFILGTLPAVFVVKTAVIVIHHGFIRPQTVSAEITDFYPDSEHCSEWQLKLDDGRIFRVCDTGREEHEIGQRVSVEMYESPLAYELHYVADLPETKQ
ncbi:hypothetical protein [Neisseria sp.]|uniref:hypothetical protein n=1 Tax=Neisseria sp. TaxID=192066 RepID=UPI00359F22D6